MLASMRSSALIVPLVVLACASPNANDDASDAGETGSEPPTAASCDPADPDGSPVAAPELLVRLADTTASVSIVPDFFVFELIHARWSNITGLPVFGEFLNSDGEFLQVVPPLTARFQMVTEKIISRQETSPSWRGS